MKRAHPTPVVWFKLHAKDLSIPAWISLRAHTLRCAECKSRLANERRERAGIEALFDDRVADRLRGVTASAEPSRRRVARAWFAIPAAALAVLMFLVIRPRSGVVGDDEMRMKGGASIFLVYVATPAGTDLLGDRCRPGDGLQAQYRTTKAQYLIVGVDPDLVARTLAPLDAATSTATAPGLQSLPQSWVLDAAPGRERFVAFFSDLPIDAARAQEAAKQEKPLLAGATAIVHECRKGPP